MNVWNGSTPKAAILNTATLTAPVSTPNRDIRILFTIVFFSIYILYYSFARAQLDNSQPCNLILGCEQSISLRTKTVTCPTSLSASNCSTKSFPVAPVAPMTIAFIVRTFDISDTRLASFQSLILRQICEKNVVYPNNLVKYRKLSVNIVYNTSEMRFCLRFYVGCFGLFMRLVILFVCYWFKPLVSFLLSTDQHDV